MRGIYITKNKRFLEKAWGLLLDSGFEPGTMARGEQETGSLLIGMLWGGIKIYGGHALGEIFPPEKYGSSHPEYYALVDGKRAVPGPNYDYKHEGQICTTNPDVIRVAVEWAINFFDAHPEYAGVHMTLNDGGGFCECEMCQILDSGEFVTSAVPDRSEPPTLRSTLSESA